MRKIKFYEGEIFHVFNKSIANYGIFKDLDNSQRFVEVLDYYNSNIKRGQSYSKAKRDGNISFKNLIIPKVNSLFKFIGYCIMPDHYHMIVKILRDKIFSKYINDIEDSFTRYFNIKFNRKGPLWQSDFRAIRIRNNEQLLHVSRYVHINPTTSFLVEKPEDWKFSSYSDFVNNDKILSEYVNEISIRSPKRYKQFVEDQIDYQRKLKLIKRLILE